MKELVFLLEEESAKAMLQGILPKLVQSDVDIRYIVFEGKQDLQRQLCKKLKAYCNQDAHFLIMMDQDSHPDCLILKKELWSSVKESGRQHVTRVRLACRELESFYLADLLAVEQGLVLPKLSRQQLKKKFRQPDNLGSPSEELCKLTLGHYQKVSGSRAIGPHLDITNCRSSSFKNLIRGIQVLAGQL